MQEIKYFAPSDVNQALKILDSIKGDKRILAGGTDLVITLREKKINPETIIDLKNTQNLAYIKQENGSIKIGAMTTFTGIVESELIKRRVIVLHESCNSIGSPQIRNWGTIGGNIINAAPAADSVPALMVLDATVKLESVSGIREFKVQDILQGINKTNLHENEILTEISFEMPSKNTVTGFRKLGRRAALSIARISIACLVEVESNTKRCRNVKIALGAVAKNPIRATSAERVLIEKDISPKLIDECVEVISEIAVENIGNRPSLPFKRQSVKGISRELLTRLYNEIEQKRRR
ncbi:MAG: xanthine dehydrogenase family protein subunit M [Tepidanaerobacteraceae bacterium]|nr:xanthine dehydrogenase family protein subunit M [Tepidanaerobacteraceae bacterium]